MEPHTNPLAHRLDERALARAEASDARRGGGGTLGPIDGVPFTLKDLIDVADIPTGAGSKLYDDNVPTRSATSAALLEAAGGVLLAKARSHEFAWGGTTLPARNAWDPDRIPGGSSGGSGSSVASGIGIFSLGTDTADSVRSPANFNGVSGLKPTYGKIGRSGVVPLAWTLDTVGVLARSVADVAVVYDADRWPGSARSHECADAARAGSRRHRRRGERPPVGVPDAYFFQTIQEPVADEVQKGARRAREAGAELVSITHVSARARSKHALTAAFIIIGAESAAFHGDWIDSKRDLYGEDVRYYLDMGRAIELPRPTSTRNARGALVAGVRSTTLSRTGRHRRDARRTATSRRASTRRWWYSIDGETEHRDPAGVRNLASSTWPACRA